MEITIVNLPTAEQIRLCAGADDYPGCKTYANSAARRDDGVEIPCCQNRDCQGLAYGLAFHEPVRDKRAVA